MDDLISREALKEAVRTLSGPQGIFVLTPEEVLEAIEKAPSGVVRCEDCKHSVWDEENEMWKCVESAEYDAETKEWFGFYEFHNGDFFCADGERKDND